MLAGVKPGLIALLLAAALAGCSSGGTDDEPRPVEGAGKGVADAIARLEAATRERDYEAICDDLFTSSARRRAGGEDCSELLRSTAGDVRAPSLRVLSIRIEGDRAQARVRTRAQGQDAIEETIELVREGGGYRISALGE